MDSAVGEPGKDKKPQKDPGEGQVKMLPQQATCPSWLCSQCLCAGSLRYGLADFVLLLLSSSGDGQPAGPFVFQDGSQTLPSQ